VLVKNVCVMYSCTVVSVVADVTIYIDGVGGCVLTLSWSLCQIQAMFVIDRVGWCCLTVASIYVCLLMRLRILVFHSVPVHFSVNND